MPKPIRETGSLAGGAVDKSGRMRVQAISAGLGSSGYYSPQVLQEAAAAGLIAAGTPMYLDHASQSERQDRPERSVRDIAAVFTEAATYDEATQALVGEVRVFAPYRDVLTEMAPYIGLSISGSATDITVGEVDGRQVPIVEGLSVIESVDWVTKAGRGGRVLAVLESAVSEARNVGQYVESQIHRDFTNLADSMAGNGKLTREERIGLSSAIGDALAAFVASLERNQPQLYTRDIYVDPENVPVTRPGSTNTTTEESEEDTMPQIEEARLRELEEAHGRVPTLESERDTAIRERDQAITERDQYRAAEAARSRTSRASDLVRTNETRVNATVVFTALEERGLLADLPLTTAGDLDEAAFTSRVNDAVTERLAGTGTITGHGGQPVSEAEAYTEFESDFFGTPKGA